MTLPSWQDKKLGSKARAALWLVAKVGEDGIFTKAELREAFPDVSQIDRRIRELRTHGWGILTSREDASLKQEEQRFVTRGAEVWIPGQAKAPKHKNSLTAAQRTKIFQADNFLCRTCGIGSGEEYGDGVEQAQLNVARRKVILPSGDTEYQFITECTRCIAGSSEREVDQEVVLEMVENLSVIERKTLAGWLAADQRTLSPLDKLWGMIRTLPEDSRKAVAQALDEIDD
ncbi:hypothetical protein NX794_14705 [Streptomyces sp. LP11]|uniref:HNH endonuclease n=1 Tax=Streptomyces pyxinicus TaxID=2970331 RepID=A0ABT2B1Q7_9ACTN|nr:hypothetical protein [Streptomyces sp. LP11]MCS0602453.1 hypothetical protein [Streptomyces sp. LP11]